MSFLGGDHSKAHFSVDVPYRLPSERMGQPDYGKDGARRREQRAKLKEHGVKTRYFQYRISDEAGKAKARADAEAEQSRIIALTGVPVEVVEGCFL